MSGPAVKHFKKNPGQYANVSSTNAREHDSPSVRDTRLADVRAVHVDVGLHALLLQVLDLSDLLEDERLIGLVALDRETCRVVAAVLHALETIDKSLKNEAAVLETSRGSVGRAKKDPRTEGEVEKDGLDATDPLAEEGRVGKDAAPVFKMS